MIDPNETFNGTWPFEPKFYEAVGFKMHYVDEGEGEPILCLHGEPTWGYLYRNFIGPLSQTNRVVVPDHMGFGKSETPQDREYTLKTHVENLTALIDELGLDNITLVIQDWGGPMGGALLATMPDRISRVFMMNTAVFPFCDMAPHYETLMSSKWFQFVRSESYDPVVSNMRYTMLSIMKMLGFQNSAAITDDWIDAYSAPFPTPEDCIGAHAFPMDMVTGKGPYLPPPSEEVIAKVKSKPAMYIAGMKDTGFPPEIGLKAFKESFGDQPIIEIPNAGHFIQEDLPAEMVGYIQELLKH